MLGLHGKRCWPIALDVGSDAIKMLQVQRVGGSLSVRACGRWRFPPPASAGDADQRRALAVAAVRDMLRGGRFRGRRVVSSLSCDELKIKTVRLPSTPPGERDRMVHREARERFGRDFARDQLHYLRAGQVRQGDDTYDEIIVLAATGEVIEAHLSLLDEAGLVPEHIDAEPLAIFRPFERMLRRRADENAITVVVDIGHMATKVVVARGRRILLVKSIDVGGKRLSQAVAKQLNISYEEACDLRLQAMRERVGQTGPAGGAEAGRRGPAGALTVLDAVRGEVEDLGREVALCLRYCAVTFRGLRPGCVTLAGGQAYDPVLVRLLGEQLGVECHVGQPLKGVDTSGVDLGGDRRGMLAEWAVCAGLAFRDARGQEDLRNAEPEGNRLSA